MVHSKLLRRIRAKAHKYSRVQSDIYRGTLRHNHTLTLIHLLLTTYYLLSYIQALTQVQCDITYLDTLTSISDTFLFAVQVYAF